MKQKLDVAAYIWPAYSGKESRNHIFWTEKRGEWQTVRDAKPKFEGHQWPRKPLLGYQDEADPKVMEEQIELALSHGVNVFIYDWYWYDGRAFQEQCLNDGFLGASNSNKMKFYLMWANHDANYVWDHRLSEDRKTVVWQGKVSREVFREIGLRWIEKYFCLENYYRVDGKPLFSIYDMTQFINGLGGIDNAREEMLWLDGKAREKGLGGVHFQMIHQGFNRKINLSGVDTDSKISCDDVLKALPFSSYTHYQYCHFAHVDNDYPTVMKEVEAEWDRLTALHKDAMFYPHISLGWDNNPRYKEFRPNILRENTPENIEVAFRTAKAYAERIGAPMVTVNSWNEWTEGSYLLPDDLYGYGYLEAIKKVFGEA